jgi:subtilisin family serine protease
MMRRKGGEMRGKGLFMMLALIGTSVMVEGAQDSEIRPPANRWEDAEYWNNRVIGQAFVCYDTDVDVYKATSKELGLADKGATLLERLNPKLNIIVVGIPEDLEGTKEFIRSIEKEPHVKWAEPNMQFHLCFTPNDPYFNSHQYDKKQMNCQAAWDLGLGSMEITAVVIDQGSQYDHSELAARYVGYVGYDFFSNDADPMPGGATESHGTHCSGNIGATINNSSGIAGVANVRMISYRCIDVSTVSTPALVNSIQQCADSHWNVVSMSWGGPNDVATIKTACINAWNAGCLLFSSSGNSAPSPILYPAVYDEVIAVGAINSSKTRASFSQYGPALELTAGGVGIISTVPFNQLQQMDGTSMSCPNAAGAGALVWSANPGATNQQVRDALTSTAEDLGTAGRDDQYGYGIPDCHAAIQALVPDTGTPLISTSDSLNFRLQGKGVSLSNPSSIEPSLCRRSTDVTSILFSGEVVASSEPSIQGFKDEDTLYYDDGTPYWGYQGSQNALFWATRFTATGQCNVDAALTAIWVFAGSPPVCSLFVWDDNSGRPGSLKAGPFAFTASGTNGWQRVDIPVVCSDDNDFWIGYWLPYYGAADSANAFTDQTSEHNNRQAVSAYPEGDSFAVSPGLLGDLSIRAIVTYGGGGLTASGNIWVKNVGTGTARLEISNVQKSEAWITQVSPTSFNVANACSSAIQVKVDGAGLQKKVLYTDEIVITSNSGKTETRVPVTLYIDDTGVEEDGISVLPTFKVSPNPSSERIDISYEVIKRGHVKLVFTDITGREVTTLSEGLETPGVKELSWRTANVPAGIYFCRFTTPDFEVTRKILLVK